MLEIVQRDEDLRGGNALRGQQFRPDAAERDLADGGGGLRVLQAGASALGQAEAARAERDRPR